MNSLPKAVMTQYKYTWLCLSVSNMSWRTVSSCISVPCQVLLNELRVLSDSCDSGSHSTRGIVMDNS